MEEMGYVGVVVDLLDLTNLDNLGDIGDFGDFENLGDLKDLVDLVYLGNSLKNFEVVEIFRFYKWEEERILNIGLQRHDFKKSICVFFSKIVKTRGFGSAYFSISLK